jgi:hypothetical protein
MRGELAAQLIGELAVVAVAGATVDDDCDAVQGKLLLCYLLHTVAAHRAQCRPARQARIRGQVKLRWRKNHNFQIYCSFVQ